MSTLPSLTEWAQSRFTALFEHHAATNTDSESSSQPSSLESQMQSLFSPTAQIYINHTGPLSVDDFAKQIGSNFQGTNKTEVEWKESLEVVDEGSKSESTEGKTGIFAGYLVVTRTLKFMIRAAPAKNYTHIWLSAKIAYDGSSSDSQVSDDADKRRIVQLFYTSAVKAAPIHLQGIPRD